MKAIVRNTLSLVISIFLYLLFQIVGSFIEFGVYGSGQGVGNNEMLVPLVMVVIQVIFTYILRRTTFIFRNKYTFILGIIIPFTLFSYFYL